MPNPNATVPLQPFSYIDADRRRHHVIAQPTTEGRWRVLDVVIVETLTGHDDGHAAAQALALDYATQQQHPRRIAA